VGCELGMDDLYRYPSIQCGIGREKDDSHSPTSQLSFEPVLGSEGGLKRGKEVDGRIAHVRDRWG
jgi:hypothetical protein